MDPRHAEIREIEVRLTNGTATVADLERINRLYDEMGY